MSADTKSRAAYPQHLTREAIAERLINTPYGEPFSEADVCESLFQGWTQDDIDRILQFLADGLVPFFETLADVVVQAANAMAGLANSILAGLLVAPVEPAPINFSEALQAKRRRDTEKAKRGTRDAIKNGRRKP